MRRCEDCHNAEETHTWLPYKQSHMETLTCETCHASKSFSPAFQLVDWTVLNPDGLPLVEMRGLEGESPTADTLVTGYTPAFLMRKGEGEAWAVSPYNLVTSYFWVSGEEGTPVSLEDLRSAWSDGGKTHPEVIARLDADGDGSLSEAERRLDTAEKAQIIASRLAAIGVASPRIVGEVRPYGINHGMASGEWATQDCQACHGKDSQLAREVTLASYVPGGKLPVFTGESQVRANGAIQARGGKLFYEASTEAEGLYVLGHDSTAWIDLAGSLVFLGVLLGVAAHGTLRFVLSLRQPAHAYATKKVYMYGIYERLWHWLQTFTILGLAFTGLVIHKPDTFGLFSFRYVVLVHNILAGILLVNAFLSLFYHLASGEIRQYLPRPAGFIDQAVKQGLYYMRGIFKGEPYPFEKTPDKKLNPLQQFTYFSILNVLLPLQVISGALMWGVQQWPELTERLGGLPFLAPFHTLVAWLFAAFIVGHVYLTTTGHTPLANIQAMMVGWDELEVHAPVEETAES
jgi:thiosulfate reductase cytochrome b subunit